jgi:hypothetical protein
VGELIRPLIPSVHSTRSLAIQRLYTLQRRIELRIEGKIIRREFTDAIKDYIARHPELSDNALRAHGEAPTQAVDVRQRLREN